MYTSYNYDKLRQGYDIYKKNCLDILDGQLKVHTWDKVSTFIGTVNEESDNPSGELRAAPWFSTLTPQQDRT